MSILDSKSKKALVESMRNHMSSILKESTTLKAAEANKKCRFINEHATYEQLLNITLNPHRDEKYLPDYVLEGAIAILHCACLTGRKNIGPNAITEGAFKLIKKTGAVVTESMLDAALSMVNEGCGLEILKDIFGKAGTKLPLTEGILDLMGITDAAIKQDIYNAARTRTQLTPVQQAAITKDVTKNVGAKRAPDVLNALSREIATGDGTLRGIRGDVVRIAKSQARADAARKLNNTAPTSLSPNELRRLQRRVAPKITSGQPAGIDPKFTAFLNKGAKRGTNPLLAAGLGAAALGAGLYGYKKLRDKQNAAMEEQ